MVPLALAAAAPPEPDQPNDELLWAEDIVVRPNYILKADDSGARLWEAAPRLAVIGGTAAQRKTVTEVVEDLNTTLKETPIRGIELVKPNDPTATLKVHLVKKSQLPTLAHGYGASPEVVKLMVKEKWGMYSHHNPSRRNKFVLQGGVALHASEPEHAGSLRHDILFQLTFVLGLANTSVRFEDSVFFHRKDHWSGAEHLSERDRKLVIWFYNHVPPGTTAIDKLYQEFWPRGK
jgi:hypothetical protein